MEEPGCEYAVESQSLQDVNPAFGRLYLPASQSMQSFVSEVPLATVVFPPRQFSHVVLPGLMLYIPRVQSKQLLLPATVWNFPAWQS
jgi:hypothetical protein|tara:strand:+ start:288 stop:548 length:261 start_codon:yes stop_codon:yes gene_type:complete